MDFIKNKSNQKKFLIGVIVVTTIIAVVLLSTFSSKIASYNKSIARREQVSCYIDSEVLEQDELYLGRGIITAHIDNESKYIYVYPEETFHNFRLDVPDKLYSDDFEFHDRFRLLFKEEHHTYNNSIDCNMEPDYPTNLEIPCLTIAKSKKCHTAAPKSSKAGSAWGIVLIIILYPITVGYSYHNIKMLEDHYDGLN